jgi:hypothetical protein
LNKFEFLVLIKNSTWQTVTITHFEFLMCTFWFSEIYIFQENSPLKGGRGHASLVIKCKLCSRENSIGNIVTLYFM